jgi:hypothetical protein
MASIPRLVGSGYDEVWSHAEFLKLLEYDFRKP